jgi:hypothetical protein
MRLLFPNSLSWRRPLKDSVRSKSKTASKSASSSKKPSPSLGPDQLKRVEELLDRPQGQELTPEDRTLLEAREKELLLAVHKQAGGTFH